MPGQPGLQAPGAAVPQPRGAPERGRGGGRGGGQEAAVEDGGVVHGERTRPSSWLGTR